MELRNNLYNIRKETLTDGGAIFEICLNAECFIYKAHFPEEPVTPGVCVTQIAVELAEEILGCKVEVTGVKNIKFASVMSPLVNTEVTYTLMIKETGAEEGSFNLQAVAQSDSEVYAKMTLFCKR